MNKYCLNQSSVQVKTQCKKLTVLACCKFLLPGIKDSNKLSCLLANIGGCMTAQLPPIVRSMTKQTFIWSKAFIIFAFDQMELCFVLISRRIISVKIGLFFQEITFITEFPCGNFLLPRFLTGGKWDFQVADLLLATFYVEPWKTLEVCTQ